MIELASAPEAEVSLCAITLRGPLEGTVTVEVCGLVKFDDVSGLNDAYAKALALEAILLVVDLSRVDLYIMEAVGAAIGAPQPRAAPHVADRHFSRGAP